jgi:ATP-dependent DNA helicase RecG
VDELDALREDWDVECKLAAGRDGRGQLPDSLWETYSAFANTNGGVVLLGVKEHDGKFLPVGISDVEKVEADLWNLVRNQNKVSECLLSASDVTRRTINGFTILRIDVPRAERQQRPVFVNGKLLEGSYRRLHTGDHRMSTFEVKRMLADADSEHPRDSRPIENFGINDVDAESLAAYRNMMRSSSPSHPFLASDDVEFLRKLGGVKRNRESGVDVLTEAGLLVFGKFQSIREHFPSFFLEYRETDGNDRTRWIDRVTPDGTWPGNLFSFFRVVFPRLTSGLKVPFRVGGELVRKDETGVHEALREAFVNALIHSDHHQKASIRIHRHPNRFEFSNPGTMLLELEQVRAGGKSECRNPSIQTMFRLVGLGERAGSGVPQILSAWRAQDWRAPDIVEDHEAGETKLTLNMLSLFPEGVVERLQLRFGRLFDDLTEPERLAVATAEAEGDVTNNRVRELSVEHRTDITQMLKSLVERGFLASYGETRGRRYRVVGTSIVDVAETLSAAKSTVGYEAYVLTLLVSRPAIRRADVVRECEMSEHQASVLLAKMTKAGQLVAEGKKRGRVYRAPMK